MVQHPSSIVGVKPVVLVAIADLVSLDCFVSSDFILLDTLATRVTVEGLDKRRLTRGYIVAASFKRLLELHSSACCKQCA